MASTDINMAVRLDTTEAEAKIAKLSQQLTELRYLLRPWWCPRWVFNLLNGHGTKPKA